MREELLEELIDGDNEESEFKPETDFDVQEIKEERKSTEIKELVKRSEMVEILLEEKVDPSLITRLNQCAELIEKTGITIDGFEVITCEDGVPEGLANAVSREIEDVSPEGVNPKKAIKRALEYMEDTTHFMFDEKKYFAEIMAGKGPIRELGGQENIEDCMNLHELLARTLREITNEYPDVSAAKKWLDDTLRRLQLLRYCSQVDTYIEKARGKVFDVGNVRECGPTGPDWINPRQIGYPYIRLIIEAGNNEGYLDEYKKMLPYQQSARGYTVDPKSPQYAAKGGPWRFPINDTSEKLIFTRNDVMEQVAALPMGDPADPKTVKINTLSGYSRFSTIAPPRAVEMNMDAFSSEEKFEEKFKTFITELLSTSSPRRDLFFEYAAEAGTPINADTDMEAIKKIYHDMPFDDRVRLHSLKWKAEIGAANGLEITPVGTLFAPDSKNPGAFSTSSDKTYYSKDGIKERIIASRTQVLTGGQMRLHQ